MMGLIIGGHMRSGTTLLWELCNSHPDILVTLEFRCYIGTGKSYLKHCREMLRRCWENRNDDFLIGTGLRSGRLLDNCRFVMQYLFEVGKLHAGQIQGSDIQRALRHCVPEARIVGDKFPYYVFILNRLVEIDNHACVIIYRDPRDVASSSLRKVRSINQPWVRFFNTAEKVARQWVRSIDSMEQHADKVHSIRYESLVSQPEVEIDKLSVYLGVDASGFSLDLVHNNSIGKYKHGLHQDELVTVNAICGPTMSRLGYS
ncbi:MAG: sulfotransferase [Anaerolineales bacterium]